MKRLTCIAAITSLLFLFGCSGPVDNTEHQRVSADQAQNATTSGTVKTVALNENDAQQNSGYATERKIIKEGDIVFTTKDVNETEKFIKEAISNFQAYISSENIKDAGDRKDHIIEVKVPAANFDPLLNSIIAGTGQPDKKDIHTQDVTEDYIDAEARIKALQNVETRYFELLKQAKTIEEMLKVENELKSVRQQIETAQGHLNYLGNKTTFSTLKITFHEPVPVIAAIPQPGFTQKFINGLHNGWEFILLLLIGLANIWPILAGAGLILFFIIRNTGKLRYTHK